MTNRKRRAKSRKKEAKGKQESRSASPEQFDGDSWELLRSHVVAIPALSDVSQSTRDELIRWLQRACPFQSFKDLQAQLSKAKIEGLKKVHQQAIVDSLDVGLTRRPFLAALGLCSLASLGVGVASLMPKDAQDEEVNFSSVPELLATVQQQRETVGRTIHSSLDQQSNSGDGRLTDSPERRQFLHALDMSNWLEAAIFLRETGFRKNLTEATAGTSFPILIGTLDTLRLAWEYLDSTRSQWEDEYFVSYAFGKMPALATSGPTKSPYPTYDAKAEKFSAAIYKMAPMFQALEVHNQWFQRPGKTRSGSSTRFTQGHNFSYAHCATDLQDRSLFPTNSRTVLVNWDAHADLGDPFENPRGLLENSFDDLQSAGTFAEKAAVSSSMSIAGWITPLIYQGLLNFEDREAHVVWVVPREAQETSNNYMEPYGEYSFVVGDWQLPMTVGEISEKSTTAVGDWNRPGSTEIRRYGKGLNLRSVISPEVLHNQQRCTLHIVDPSDVDTLDTLMKGAHIALSVDVDFAGTREPGLSPRKGFLPHYPLTGSAEKRARHEQLLQQLAEFYNRYEKQILTVTIANSPNFTVEEEIRKPVARVLEIVAGNNIEEQPDWIAGELQRVAPRESGSHSNALNAALSAGGLAGLAITTSLLTRDWRRQRKIRELLLANS